MKRLWLLVLVAAAAAAGWWWRESLFPGELTRVRRSLEALATEVSFTSKEGGISTGRRISSLVDHFTPEAVIEVEILGAGTFHLNGRGEIQQAMWGARRAASSLQVRFFDILVDLASDGQTASAHLTATADAKGKLRNQEGFEAMEFRFQLRRMDGAWKVQQVATVQTLKQ